MKYLVTGANRGIGLEFVHQLVARGDEVIATCRNPEEATDLLALAETSGQVRVLPLDITSPEGTCKLAGALGDESLDVLINNAGVGARGGRPGKFDYNELRFAYEVNALGALRVTEAVLEPLRRGGAKKVMNITSKMGSIDDNGSGGSYAYRMSKAALNMATRSLAIDLKPEGFVVFVIHPGWVETDMGGEHALIDTETSVKAMLGILDEAGPDASGKFWEWKGNEIPW